MFLFWVREAGWLCPEAIEEVGCHGDTWGKDTWDVCFFRDLVAIEKEKVTSFYPRIQVVLQ